MFCLKFITSLFVLCILCVQYSVAQDTDSTAIKKLQQENEARKQQVQQLNKEVTELKAALKKQQQQGFDKFMLSSNFLDAAISSTNSLQTLVLKESYRNKIVSLNNPTSNELGFNLELEIQNALKPIMDKTSKTNAGKLSGVVSSVMQTGKTGASLFPAGNVFTSLISMVGGVTVQEKKVEKEDLDNFIRSIEKYFSQYQKLHTANLRFNSDMEKLKARIKLLQDDIKLQLQDLIVTLNKTVKRSSLKNVSIEDLMLKYYDAKRITELLNKQPAGSTAQQFPPDAIKGCKEIANNIQRIYDEYAIIYNSNYKEIRSVIADTKTVITTADQLKLNTTLRDLDALYNESKTADADNLRLKTMFDRLETLTQ